VGSSGGAPEEIVGKVHVVRVDLDTRLLSVVPRPVHAGRLTRNNKANKNKKKKNIVMIVAIVE